MGYREDPDARANLNAAFTGLGVALLFIAVVGISTYFMAKNATPHHGPEGGTPAAASQH
jgi:hypothetical protein